MIADQPVLMKPHPQPVLHSARRTRRIPFPTIGFGRVCRMADWWRGMACLVVAAGLFPFTAAQGQSLNEALERAYWNNPTLKAERSALAAVDLGVTEALSAWRPTVVTTLGRSRSYLKGHDTDGRRGTGILPSDLATITLSQRVADFGQTSGAVRAAETEQNVLLETAQAYLDVVRALAGLDLNRANVQVLTRQLAAAEAGFERQMTTQTDVAQARARRANALAELRQAEEALDSARGRYLALVGEAAVNPEFPNDLPDLPGRDELMRQAEGANPKVQAALYATEAAQAAVDSSEAAILPTVTFEASDSYRTNTSVTIHDERVQNIGLVMRVPLYQSGAEYARIQARKQELGQRRQLLDAARRSARLAAQEAWNGLEAARARVESYDASVKANQIAQEGVVAEYMRLGTRTLLDVLNAEQELFEARINLIGARRDEAVAAYRAMAATGRMTAESLALAVVRYDAAAHYDEVRGLWFGWGDSATSAGERPPPPPRRRRRISKADRHHWARAVASVRISRSKRSPASDTVSSSFSSSSSAKISSLSSELSAPYPMRRTVPRRRSARNMAMA
jgi:outer membrane protein